MSYVYLLDLYKLINKKLAEAEQSKDEFENDPEDSSFREGQIDILLDFRDFLIDNLNPKLPKAVRKNLSRKTKTGR